VIIHNFNIEWLCPVFRPFKTDAPLLIDPNAELSYPVASEGFKMVAWQPY